MYSNAHKGGAIKEPCRAVARSKGVRAGRTIRLGFVRVGDSNVVVGWRLTFILLQDDSVRHWILLPLLLHPARCCEAWPKRKLFLLRGTLFAYHSVNNV